MKHFQIKFNHGVEIGAYLAYSGHARRVNDFYLTLIMADEYHHRQSLKSMLRQLNTKPSIIIDSFFYLIGYVIYALCQISPVWSLNFIARMMEKFAIFNYRSLAKKYPQWKSVFTEMADTEQEHEAYFTQK